MLAHSLRRPLLLSLGVLACAALLTGLLSLRPALAAEAVTLNPTEGPPETQVTATGSGWTSRQPGHEISVRWGDLQNPEVARTTVDNNGGFTVSFRVPKEATPGTHNIYFVDRSPRDTGGLVVFLATFTVTGALPQPPPAPTSPQPPASSGLCNGDERMTFEPDHPVVGQPVSIHVGSERLSADVALSGPHNPSYAGVRSRGRGYRWTWTVTPDQPGRYEYAFTVGGTVCTRNFVQVDAAPAAAPTPVPTATPPTPGPAPTPLPPGPGGAWISPGNRERVSNSVHLAAYASAPSGVDYVQFTWRPAHEPDNGNWFEACKPLSSPTHANVYECDWDPAKSNVPASEIKVSFDIRDKAGRIADTPDGVLTIIYDPKPPSPQEIDYFALGDSVAAGHGLHDNKTECRQSAHAYPFHVHRELQKRYKKVNFPLEPFRSHFLACSGATTTEPKQQRRDLTKWFHDQVKLALVRISDRPTLVSITIGAIDFGWSDLGFWASTYYDTDVEYVTKIEDITKKVKQSVKDEVRRLLSKRNVAVVITQYYNPMNSTSLFYGNGLLCRECHLRTDALVRILNTAFAEIQDELIKEGVSEPQRLQIALVYEVFRGRESPQPECGTSDPSTSKTWIQYVHDPNSNSNPLPSWNGDCFHPRENGAAALARAVDEAARTAGR